MLTWDKQGTSVRTTDGEFIEAENRRRTLFNKIIDANIITFPESSQFYIVYYDDSKNGLVQTVGRMKIHIVYRIISRKMQSFMSFL